MAKIVIYPSDYLSVLQFHADYVVSARLFQKIFIYIKFRIEIKSNKSLRE